MGIPINEAMKLAGDRNVWRSTVSSTWAASARRLRHRRRCIKSSQISQGVESCTIMFLRGTSYSLAQTMLL